MTLFVFQLELHCLGEKGQGSGEWILGRVERKIFHFLETEQLTRKQRDGAVLIPSLPWSAQGFEEAGGQGGVQQEEHWGHLDMVSDHPGII